MGNDRLLIEVAHVSAMYENRLALHDVSLQLEKNSFLGIAGPNGGGKTTLLRLLLGLMKPSAGTISFYRNGQPCRHLSMGYLPQQTTSDNGFPLTVEEVVLSGALGYGGLRRSYTRQEREQAHAIMEEVGIDGLHRALVGELSGGQRQRALLARALMCRPEVLVLDEPNTFFDIKARSWMLEELRQLQQKCAVIMVSHDLRDLFAVTDQIAYIHRHLHLYRTAEVSLSQLEEDILNSHCDC